MKILKKNPDKASLSAKKIEKYLTSEDRYKIICFSSLGSTQDALKSLAYGDVPDGQVFIADRQSGGRGREGRSFFSPADSGIYMSLLLRPSVSAQSLLTKDTIFITVAAAISVAEAIEEITKKKADIKWVNDIIHNGLKVSGILTEAAFNNNATSYDHVIVGIGINLYKNNFPSELNGIAGALYNNKPLNVRKLKSRLIADILNRFEFYYGMISYGKFSFIIKYKERSLVIGKKVDIIIGDSVTGCGEVLSLNDDCSLNIKMENGEIRTLYYGEVRIKLNEQV